MRIPGICNFNPETTVGAHRNGAGWSLKQDDNEMAYCCSACHDALDGRRKTEFTDCELKLMHLEGIMRTQKILIKKGLLKIA